MYTKNSFKMLAIILSLIGLSSIEAYSATITWDGDAANDNWFEPTNWDGDVLPDIIDDVVIDDGSTVNVNGNVNINSLTVTNGIVRPDASSGRTIIIARNLTLDNNGSILYTDAGGTGRLSWTFQGQDGSNIIDNQSDGNEADLQFYNVTIDGTITTAAFPNRGDMSIYGNLTVNGSFSPNNTVGNSTVHFIGIPIEGSKSISNNGTLDFNAVELSTDASITTITGFGIIGDLDIAGGSSLAINNPAILTTNDVAPALPVTYTNNGTLSFALGTTWNINKDLTIAEDITGVAGAVSLEAGANLTVASTKEIIGTGTFTAGNLAGVIVSDADGVAGAIALSGGYTWPTGANAVNVTIESGSTGFTGASLTEINNLTFGPAVDPNAALTMSTNDSFTMSGDLVVNANTLATTVTASSGTITMDGAGAQAINLNQESLDLFGLVINGTGVNTVTIEDDNTLTIANTLNIVGDDILTFGGVNTNNQIIFDDNASLLTDVATALTLTNDASLEITGTLTLLSDINVGAITGGGVNVAATGTLDFQGNTLTIGATGELDTEAGSTLISAASTGLAGNITQAATLDQADPGIDPGTNLEYKLNAQSLGLHNVDGNNADITTINDLTIDGAIVTTNGDDALTLTINGDLHIQDGSMILATDNQVIQMEASAGQEIINDESAASLDFQTLVIVGGQTVTTDDSFTISGDLPTAIRVQAGSFVASTPSTIFFEGSGGTQGLTNAGAAAALTVHNLTINDNAQSVTLVAGDLMTITGDLTIVGTGTGFVSGAAGQVSFGGTGTQTITTTAGDLSLDLLTIAATSNVVTTSDFILNNTTGPTDIDGTFAATGTSNITFADLGNLDVDAAGSATFSTLTATGATSASGAGTIHLISNLTGADYDQAAGTLNIIGNTANADAITGADGLLEALIDVTQFDVSGAVTIPSTAELRITVVQATGGTMSVAGRLQMDGNSLTVAAAITMVGDGDLHISNALAADIFSTVFAGGVTETTNTDIIIEGAHAAGGIGIGGLNFGNLTVNSTDNVVLQSSATINSTFNNYSDQDFAAATSGTVTFVGTSDITSTNDPTPGDIRLFAASFEGTTTIDTEFDLYIDATADEAISVGAGNSLTASAGKILFSAANADPTIALADATATLQFHDLEIETAATTTDFNFPIIINGSLTQVGTGELQADDANADITFNGTNEAINIATTGTLDFFDVTFDGSYNVDGTAGTELINVFGDLTVTGNGSLEMTDGGISFGDGAGPVDDVENLTITNNGSLQFHDLVINKDAAGDEVNFTDNYTVTGNLTNTQGELRNTTNEVTFEGSGTITSEGAPATSTFTNVSFDGTTTLGAGGLDIAVGGNFIVSNGNSAQSSTFTDAITFIGSSSKEIVNAGTLTFGAITVADEDNNIVTTDDSFTISGTFTVGGGANDGESFAATDGVITFNGGGAQALTNSTGLATGLQLDGVTITGASTDLNTTGDFYVNGDIVVENDAIFDMQTPGSRLVLNGTTQQNITLTGTGDVGTSARFLANDVTLTNEDGYILNNVTNSIVDDQFDVEGTFRIQNGDFDLNGENVLTIDVTNGGQLFEIEGNTVVNNGPSTSTGNVYATQTGPTLNSNNFGGLGAIITTDNTGIMAGSDLTVRRYHIAREIAGNTQASRYYSITENDADDLNARVSFEYDPSEIGNLTENDLILLYSDDEDGPWFKQLADLNTTLKRQTVGVISGSEKIDNFTGATEFWTFGTPSELSATQLTNGLASDTLAAGTSDNAIFGVQFTADGDDITMNSTTFNLGRTLNATTAEFTEYALYYSADNNYATTSDNVAMINGSATIATITGGSTSDDYVAFNLASVDASYVTVSEGTPVNYFLVVTTQEDLNLNTATITPSITQNDIAITEGVSNPFDLTGTTYRFRSSIEVSPNENGLSESPLVAGADGYAIFGFKATITNTASLPGFTGFTLDFEGDPSAVFENIKVFESEDDSDFSTSADNEEITLTSSQLTDSSMVFNFAEQNLDDTEPQYYFVTADVKNTVDPGVAAVTPTMVYSKITSVNAGIRGTDINGETAVSHEGYTYDFIESTVTLSTGNNPAAGNLGRNLGEQPVYGFTLTPDNNQAVTLDSIDVQVTFSDETESANVDSWKLFVDQNGNGYGDNLDRVILGDYSGGVLSFGSIAETFSAETKFIVTARVRSTVAVGTTIALQILGEDYLTIDQPNTVNAGGPFPITASVHTVQNSGVATAVEIAGTYETTVITGETLSFIVRAVDANGYPTRVTSNAVITIDNGAGAGTVGGTNTGTIFSGSGFQVIEPTISNATVSTNLQVDADDAGSLTTSGLSNEITILLAAPASNAGEVILNDITATSVGISAINAPAANGGDGRIVVVKQGGRPDAPTNGINYTASTDLSNAGVVGVGQTGPGSYVVYNTGSGVPGDLTNLSVDVTGLLPNKRYYFMVFDYNGTVNNLTYATATNFTTDASQNPKFVTTLEGTLSNADSTNAVNIQTDVDVASAITASNQENWFKFRVSGTKVNARLIISNLPADYHVDIYDGTGNVSDIELLRQSQVSGTSNEVLILNDLSPSETYYIKVYGDDSDQYSTSSYNLRVSTSAREFYSLTQE